MGAASAVQQELERRGQLESALRAELDVSKGQVERLHEEVYATKEALVDECAAKQLLKEQLHTGVAGQAALQQVCVRAAVLSASRAWMRHSST